MASKTIHARLIAQTNAYTNERNVHFLTDPTASIEDCLLHAMGWTDPQCVEIHNVTLSGSPEALAMLVDQELRSVNNSDGSPLSDVAPDTIQSALDQVPITSEDAL